MATKRHSNVVCAICDTDLEVPFCCSEEMAIVDNMLICNMCGSKRDIPICCGKPMQIVVS